MGKREQIRQSIATTHKADFDTIFGAIADNQDIVPALPEAYIQYLRDNIALANALDDADFILGLTIEILPEYSDLLDSRRPWLERQLTLLRSRVENG